MNTGSTGWARHLPCIVPESSQQLTSNRETKISVKNPQPLSSEEAEDRAQGSRATGLRREDFRRDQGGEAWIYVHLCMCMYTFHPFSQIRYSWDCILTRFMCHSQINTCIPFIVIHGHKWSSETLKLPERRQGLKWGTTWPPSSFWFQILYCKELSLSCNWFWATLFAFLCRWLSCL